MKKLKQVILCIVPFLCALLIQTVISMSGVFVFADIKGAQYASQGITNQTELTTMILESLVTGNGAIILSALASIACLIVFALWYKHIAREESPYRIKGVFGVKNISFIILMGIGLQVGLSGILMSLESCNPEWFEDYNKLMSQLIGGNAYLSFLYVGIIAPISEELIFRGVIQQKAKKIMPFMVVNLFQAFLFGVMHMNLIQGTYAFFLGLLLGMVCLKSKSIYASILLHMAVNICGIILGAVFTDDVTFKPAALFGMIVCSAIVVALCSKFFPNKVIQLEDVQA